MPNVQEAMIDRGLGRSRQRSGSNFEGLQNHGVNKTDSEVVEPTERSFCSQLSDQSEFAGPQRNQCTDGADTQHRGEIHREGAGTEKTQQKTQSTEDCSTTRDQMTSTHHVPSGVWTFKSLVRCNALISG